MGCISTETPESRIRDLEERLKRFVAFARAHAEWEAEVLCSDGPWFDEMPEDLMVRMERLQELRDRALGI